MEGAEPFGQVIRLEGGPVGGGTDAQIQRHHPDDPDVQIIAWTATPGSASRERLARLRILA